MTNPHIWDLFAAPRISRRTVSARLRQGWVLFALPPEQTYCSAGAAGSYSHALVSPSGELAQLTNRALPELSFSPAVLSFESRVIELEVPFEEKDQVKALGAKWAGHLRKWLIRPSDAEKFKRWLPQDHEAAKLYTTRDDDE